MAYLKIKVGGIFKIMNSNKFTKHFSGLLRKIKSSYLIFSDILVAFKRENNTRKLISEDKWYIFATISLLVVNIVIVFLVHK